MKKETSGSAKGGREAAGRKSGGAGAGSTSTGSVSPGMGTPETSPKGDLRHPGGIARGLAENLEPEDLEE